MNFGYDYESCVSASERVTWRLDEVFAEGTPLDFSRRFLPERLTGTVSLSALLSDTERRKLNQISSNAYLNLFAFVEEYILATMLKHAQAEVFGQASNLRALTRFVDEELKHQALFHRYRRSFDEGFGERCTVLETAVEVAALIMSHSPMAVLLITLHIEVMTQQHYTECVKDDADVDPLFKSLLKHHWLEEAQHAKIDALELGKLASAASREQVERAFDEYLGILAAFDGLLAEQAKMDVASLSRATGRTFDDAESAAIRDSQHRAYQRTFIWYGMTNPTFITVGKQLSPAKSEAVAEGAKKYAGTTVHVA